MNFSEALEQIKAGERMRRSGWNGKGQFVFLVPGSKFKVNRAPMNVVFPEGTEINYQDHIDIFNAQGGVVPWQPSQGDLMAEDWEYATAGA